MRGNRVADGEGEPFLSSRMEMELLNLDSTKCSCWVLVCAVVMDVTDAGIKRKKEARNQS